MLAYSDVVSVQPTHEPITVAAAREHCDLDDNHFDSQLVNLITLARTRVEHDTRRALMTQTRVYRTATFPATNELVLPSSPLQSVTSVTYTTEAGATQTFTDYAVDTYSNPGYVYLNYNSNWPTNRGHNNDVTITYVAGYGTTAAVPEAAKHAILLMVRHYFDHPTAVSQIAMTETPQAYQALINHLKTGVYP